MSQDLQKEVATLSEQAKAIVVMDVATCQAAGAMRKVLKAMENTIIDHYKPMKQAQDAAKKVILDQEKESLKPIQDAYAILSKGLTDFLNAEEEKRVAAEREQMRLNELAAEKEREKLLKKAVNAKSEEKQEELLEQAEAVYAAPVAVAHTVAAPIAGVTRRKDTVVTVQIPIPFMQELIQNHGNAALNILEIKPGPLKSFIKANGIKSFAGLIIEEKFV